MGKQVIESQSIKSWSTTTCKYEIKCAIRTQLHFQAMKIQIPAITFDGDCITLDIPDDGITINGWEILPVHKAHVSPSSSENC